MRQVMFEFMQSKSSGVIAYSVHITRKIDNQTIRVYDGIFQANILMISDTGKFQIDLSELKELQRMNAVCNIHIVAIDGDGNNSDPVSIKVHINLMAPSPPTKLGLISY